MSGNTADILQMISVISFAAAGVFAIVAAVIWIVLGIPGVVSDLSGRTAKKSIEKMRRNNEKTGEKVYRASRKNLERGKLTGTMDMAGKALNNSEKPQLLRENATGIRKGKETDILSDDATEPLSDSGATVPLDPDSENSRRVPARITVQVLGEIELIHTEEVI